MRREVDPTLKVYFDDLESRRFLPPSTTVTPTAAGHPGNDWAQQGRAARHWPISAKSDLSHQLRETSDGRRGSPTVTGPWVRTRRHPPRGPFSNSPSARRESFRCLEDVTPRARSADDRAPGPHQLAEEGRHERSVNQW